MAPKPWNCDGCPTQEVFATREKLKAHRLNAHPFLCPQCEEPFAYTTGLREHQKKNHPKSRHRVYPCNVKGCEAKFSTSFLDMYAHELQVHGIARPYECEVESCLKRFSNPSNRGRHLREEHKDDHYKFKCPACAASYKSEYVRDKHYQTKHVEPQPPKPKRVRKRKSAETSSRPAKTLKLQAPASIQINGQVISMEIVQASGAQPLDILGKAIATTIEAPVEENPKDTRDRIHSEDSNDSGYLSPNSVEAFQPELVPITEEQVEDFDLLNGSLFEELSEDPDVQTLYNLIQASGDLF